jgi:hypothetical protein
MLNLRNTEYSYPGEIFKQQEHLTDKQNESTSMLHKE